jgi:hypothetical protein
MTDERNRAGQQRERGAYLNHDFHRGPARGVGHITAAIFGLLGVVVGAVINGAVSAVLQRRTERSELRSAARLVRTELVFSGPVEPVERAAEALREAAGVQSKGPSDSDSFAYPEDFPVAT